MSPRQELTVLIDATFSRLFTTLHLVNKLIPFCRFSAIDHRRHQNVVRTKKWHTSGRRVCHWCYYHILTSSVIYSRHTAKWDLSVYTMNRKEKWGKLQTSLVSDPLFEDLFQLRYFSSRQEHFSSRFLLFLACKQLLLNFFRGLQLLNPE